jgi:gas vesicle protein
VDNLSSEIHKTYESVDQFKIKLFGNEENSESIESKIDEWVESIEKKYDEINNYHDETLVGIEGAPSTQQLVSDAKKVILSQQSKIEEILMEISPKITNLELFHQKVFGKLNTDNEYEGGISQEFEKRVTALNVFEGKQVTSPDVS